MGDVSSRIESLRELMRAEEVSAYIVPSTDPHQSEYVPDCWQRRRWISGFTGSAGDVAVWEGGAGLWTDGRYFIQAEEQLKGSGITLFKSGMPDVPKMEEHLCDVLTKGDRVGIDPKVVSIERAKELEKAFHKKGILVRYIEVNLVDEIWKDRPAIPEDIITLLSKRFTGETVPEKLFRIRDKMARSGATSLVLSSLDAIAWTYNLRGSDVEYNPVFIAYSVIGANKAYIFIEKEKVAPSVKRELSGIVEFHGYEELGPFLEGISKQDGKVWIDERTTNKWIRIKLGESKGAMLERSPVTDFKSMKNGTELRGFREAHVRDGMAMVKFLSWLDRSFGKVPLSEVGTARKVEEIRIEGKDYVGPSFATIAAMGPHGAIIHYEPTNRTDVPITEGIYLLDSGGQYLMGTTDITRTVALGEPTQEQKEMFTRVLKGHIAIATLRFPKGFSGKQIDAFARRHLWEAGKNYNHGTGHGIGHFLNVHEGPMGITPRDPGVPLAEGNVLSNEPGYYKEGEYGMRTESVVVVVKDQEFSTPETPFLKFETITMCPIDLKLIEKRLLTKEERKWLNDYHRTVYRKLSRKVDPSVKDWLREKTRRI